MLKQQAAENAFAPEGYEQVLPNWPVSALPRNESVRNFSEDELARGRRLLSAGLDSLAASCGVTDAALIEQWRSRWDALPASIDGSYNNWQAPTALYAEMGLRWFRTAERAAEYVEFFAQDQIREGMVRKKTPAPKLPPVDLRVVVAKVHRSRMSPADYRHAVEMHGSGGVHRMVESLGEGGLEVLLDEGFPVRYMADVPPKWTRFRDVVAKAAHMNIPHGLLPRMFDRSLSADDADYLFANMAPEYIDALIPA